MNEVHPIAQSIANNPLLIDPSSVDLINASINYLAASEESAKLFDEGATAQANADDDDFWPDEDDFLARYRPYNVKDGVLSIPVQGMLLHKFPYSFGRWATGYSYIEKALSRGMSDPDVRAIALIVDSPGGEAAGCFECADKIFDARGEKPIRAFSSDAAYSAAYALASSADDIVVTRSGGTGSVGVVTAHFDLSEALASRGIKVTYIFAGKHKVDGNSYQALPDSVKARIQVRIDRLYGIFTAMVSRNRGMDDEAVRETEALTYDAQDSLAIGFADKIGAFDEEMANYVAEQQEVPMTLKNSPAANTETAITASEHETAVNAAKASGVSEGMAAQKARITAILGSDAGKARPKAALSAAMRTEMTADEATAFLADLPEETAKAPAPAPAAATPAPAATTTPFDDAMGKTTNPEVGANAPADGQEEMDDDEKATASIVSSISAMRGTKRRA